MPPSATPLRATTDRSDTGRSARSNGAPSGARDAPVVNAPIVDRVAATVSCLTFQPTAPGINFIVTLLKLLCLH
jgi:hypothetical protein